MVRPHAAAPVTLAATINPTPLCVLGRAISCVGSIRAPGGGSGAGAEAGGTLGGGGDAAGSLGAGVVAGAGVCRTA
jgi:hypothetical protein